MFNSLSGHGFVSVALIIFTLFCAATFISYLRNSRKCRCTKRYTREDFVLIIGSAPGVALETAMGVVKRGGRVVLANKTIADSVKLKNKILHKLNPENNSVFVMKLNFTSFKQIRIFVRVFKLIFRVPHTNNLAGIVITEELRNAPHELTEDQYDKIFQINFLGPFLLIKCLDRILKSHPDPRIVTLSSGECSPCQYSDIAHVIMSPRSIIRDRNLAYHISKVCTAMVSVHDWKGAHCVDPEENNRDNVIMEEEPLKGVEGVLHALLKPSEEVSYTKLRRIYSNISPLCVHVIDELENNIKNVLCTMLYCGTSKTKINFRKFY